MTKNDTTSLGLKRGTVKLSPSRYDEWQKEYEKEKAILLDKIGDSVSEIHHVGSTSVPGLAAKPIIDIIAVIDKLDDYKGLIAPLEELGYHFMPDRVFEIRDRVFFPKGPESNRTHHLSLVVKDTPQYRDNLLFRDYLRKDSEAREGYQLLKEELARKYADDRESYAEAKEQFIVGILGKAKEELK